MGLVGTKGNHRLMPDDDDDQGLPLVSALGEDCRHDLPRLLCEICPQ